MCKKNTLLQKNICTGTQVVSFFLLDSGCSSAKDIGLIFLAFASYNALNI